MDNNKCDPETDPDEDDSPAPVGRGPKGAADRKRAGDIRRAPKTCSEGFTCTQVGFKENKCKVEQQDSE